MQIVFDNTSFRLTYLFSNGFFQANRQFSQSQQKEVRNTFASISSIFEKTKMQP